MLSEEHQGMMLAYLSGLRRGARLRTLDDLAALPSRELLSLARRVDEAALGLFVQLLKDSGRHAAIFQKLMGDHEEENRPLVDAFFDRYFKAVLSCADPSEASRSYNPLETYLPAHSLDDLAFVQSRQPFFLRQPIEVINRYLDGLPGCREQGPHAFKAGEQELAWACFWDKVVSR